MKSTIGAIAGTLVLALTLAAPAFASDAVSGAAAASPDQFVQVEPAYVPQPDYGTAQQSVYTVRIEDFLPPNSTVTYSTINTGGIFVYQASAGTGDWWARVQVPSGALIESIEMQACDTTATGNIVFGMARMDAPGQTGSNVTPIGDTGAAATPGCAFFSVTPTGGSVQVDNDTKSYILFVDWFGDFTSANKVAAFRVHYRLQVSPAPATATFPVDVPTTHPFFRFVEAMAASGLTGGCGAGAFCPDVAVTRGQMSVFLATALGLNFPR